MSNRSRDRIEKYLFRQLNVLEDGEQLPSVRTIIKDCQSSQSTVQAVLQQYEQKKLIVSQNRRGYFKVSYKNTIDNLGKIDLIFCTTAQGEDPLLKFHGEFSHLLSRCCGEKWRSVMTHFFESHTDWDSLRQLATNNSCRACILVAPPNNEYGKILNEHHIAYVNVFPESSQLDPLAPSILIDNDKVIKNQISYLYNLGHRKIAYLDNLYENEVKRDFVQRREAFYRYSHQLNLSINPEWIQLGGYHSDSAIEGFSKILATNPQPTSVICSDHHLPAVYRVLNDRNLTPGEDFSIVSTDNLPICQIMSPQATSLDTSRTKAAQLAIKTLEQILDGEEVENVLNLDSEVVIRQSASPITVECEEYSKVI